MTKPNKTSFEIPYLSCGEIRKQFLDFFKEKNHKIVRSASIAPQDDPTLLFTNSGMNQFKSIFLGDNKEGLTRVADSQKCLRVSGKHNDLDEVGRDGTHHTFFEMLGNWSFGDYYKKEAITWAWELLTKKWKLPKDRLFVTVHLDDDEAAEIWQTQTDIEAHRILRFDKDNFWEMGPVGPCGPCSEINFDTGDLATQGETYNDKVLGVNGENDRYVEIWNLVFMQYERLKDGSLIELKQTHVDTGSGLERLCSVIQGKRSNYETDVFTPLIEKIQALSGVEYCSSDKGVAHRVIADHIRALAFAIADGVTPGNEGRGYVMRRILRRASRFAHGLGQKQAFLYKLVPVLVEQMAQAYPELAERQSYISQVIESEEQRFLNTLDQGLQKLDRLIAKLKESSKTKIDGEQAFLFHDTYGFPVDLTQIIAGEHGLQVDEEAYDRCMLEQKERARKSAKFDSSFSSEESWSVLAEGKDTRFLGYETLSAKVKVLRYQEQGDFIYLVLDQSPFYSESGGQVGDQGLIESDQVSLRVQDTTRVFDMHIHKCSLVSGLFQASSLQGLVATVDSESRKSIAKNHSATHLLHAALKAVLGDHISQQGSYVGADRLRFDFTHHQGLGKDELVKVEDMINEKISQNISVETNVMSYDEAKQEGATALFGEKYGDTVRVLSMGAFSKELCGGTHVKASGEIGVFRIIGETSIAAGVRRVEAVTGSKALQLIRNDHETMGVLCQSLKVKPEAVVEKVEQLKNRVKELERMAVAFKQQAALQKLNAMINKSRVQLGDAYYLVGQLSGKDFSRDQLQFVLDHTVAQYPDTAAVYTHIEDGSLSILSSVGKKLAKHLKANELIKELAKVADGRGGGRPDRARAGAKDCSKEQAVIELALEKLQAALA